MPATPLQERRRLSGHLRLTASSRDNGSTYLSRKSFRAPMHVSKPYWDGHNLLVNAMSPTAGLLEGDHIEIDVQVEPASSLTLSNPAALRVHKMDTGKATLSQTYRIASGGILETNPEWLIPQAHSRFTQHTAIHLDPGATLLFIEAIAPGRVAHGECFAFARLRNALRLQYDKRLAALERYALQPSQGTHAPWAKAFPAPYFASLFLVSDKLDDRSSLWKNIHALAQPELLIGSSKLAHGPCWNTKILSPNPSQVRIAIETVREVFYQAIGRSPAKLRRQ